MKAERIAKQQTQNYYDERNNFEVRPVTKEDKWCRFQTKFENELDCEAPYGYLVIVPKYFDGMELELNGCIIKNRLFKGMLFLQIVQSKKYLGEGRIYVTRVYSIKSTEENTTSRYLNIRNLNKVRPIRYY